MWRADDAATSGPKVVLYTPKSVPDAANSPNMAQISSFLAMWRADDAANRTRPPNDFTYAPYNFV